MAASKPGFQIVRNFERPAADLIQQFHGLAAANLSDVQGRQNTLDWRVKPIYAPMAPLCGPAFTVKARPGDNLLATKAIHMAQPGDVIVISSEFDTNLTVWGGVMSAMARKKGIAGVVTDGLVRDVAEIREAGFPVFSIGLTPVGPTKEGSGQINLPLSCGGVIINPGDIIVGDEDGVVAVQRAEAQAVLERVHARKKLEDEWFAAIERGETILETSDDELIQRGAVFLD